MFGLDIILILFFGPQKLFFFFFASFFWDMKSYNRWWEWIYNKWGKSIQESDEEGKREVGRACASVNWWSKPMRISLVTCRRGLGCLKCVRGNRNMCRTICACRWVWVWRHPKNVIISVCMLQQGATLMCFSWWVELMTVYAFKSS